MKTILHISADFPDALVPRKTRAVENLLAATKGFRHVVYSLNRVSWKRGLEAVPFGQDRTAIAYGAPPYGVGLTRYLRAVTEFIADDLAARRIKPDAIHAHKLAVEGPITADLARSLNCPFLVSLWGDTDTKFFEKKRRLRNRYREIAGGAALLLPAAPWTADYFGAALRLEADRFEVLPVMSAADTIVPPAMSDTPRLVSVFSLDFRERKGLDVLAQAMLLARNDNADVSLDIYGGGSPQSLFEAREVIRKAGASELIALKGAAPHGDIQDIMNGYAAFVMAPRRETYGMVHVEALLAGLPILWSRERGIDGYFRSPVLGYRAEPESAEDIATGIRFLIANQNLLKGAIAREQRSGAFNHLRCEGIARQYAGILSRITGAPVSAPASVSRIGPRHAEPDNDQLRQMPRVS